MVKEIIDQGHDQEQFSKFLLAQRGGTGALDIDQWTFQELDRAVQEFQEKNKNPYIEDELEPRFYVKKRDDFNWVDLEEEA